MDFPILEDVMPHRPPMLLLRRLLDVGDNGASAEARFDSDSPFARLGGVVDEAAHFELMAQTFAAFMAVRHAREGTRAGAGYLASLRDVAILGAARLGEALRVTVRLVGEVEGFFVVQGEVARNSQKLAEGQVMIFLPEGRDP